MLWLAVDTKNEKRILGKAFFPSPSDVSRKLLFKAFRKKEHSVFFIVIVKDVFNFQTSA